MEAVRQPPCEHADVVPERPHVLGSTTVSGKKRAARSRPIPTVSCAKPSPARVDVQPFNNLTGEDFVLRYLFVLLAPLALGGCFFFMLPIPSQLFSSANACAWMAYWWGNPSSMSMAASARSLRFMAAISAARKPRDRCSSPWSTPRRSSVTRDRTRLVAARDVSPFDAWRLLYGDDATARRTSAPVANRLDSDAEEFGQLCCTASLLQRPLQRCIAPVIFAHDRQTKAIT
jgi:hypothetical protein